MENTVYSDELQHHGIKGMRWGQRRYQNKDGTLTPAGKKRYNKEVEKLKAEEAKLKAEEKAAANRRKTQAKFDKLDAKKQELEERKKALKGNSDNNDDDTPEESAEERRAKALSSTDPKEIYKNKDLLTYNELNERVNRIDLEARLQNKIPAEPTKKTVLDRVDATKNAIDKATNLYKSVDNAYSAVANSAIGKTLAKNLGIELPKNEKTRESLSDFVKNINKKDDKDVQDRVNFENNKSRLMDQLKRDNKPTEIESDEDFYKNISSKSDQEVADRAKRIGNSEKIGKAIGAVANNSTNDISKNINVDDVRSIVEDAVEEIMRDRNK